MVLIIKIIKRLTAAALVPVLAAALCAGHAYALDQPAVSAKSAVVLCSGYTLFEKNADVKMPMASTTKLMTAIIAIESCPLDERVEIKPEYCNIEGSSMYLMPGESYSVKELVEGLLLVSGNDAATALACHVAGSTERFAALMNEKAARLGMSNTHFVNPHGLSENGHYSTARDMARLMEYCMEDPAFAEIDAMKNCTAGGRLLVNHNRLLDLCPGCVGGKTGFTEAAGRCLVSCCEREGTRLVCVTLSAPDDWNDHMGLYGWAYSRCTARSVTDGLKFSVPVISGESRWAYLAPEEDKSLFLPADMEIKLTAELPWFVFAPVEAGKKAGKVTVSVDGKCLAEYYLVYTDTVPLKRGK